MNEIQLRELYKILLSIFDLPRVPTELMFKVIAGSEKADDYEEICRRDRFFTATICRLASATMKSSVVSSLGHGVVLFGQQKVRDMVLGHSIERLFSPHADNSFAGPEASEKMLKYALKCEEHARKCKNEYSGMAFAGGFLFDVFNRWIQNDQTAKSSFEDFFEKTFRHSINTATFAWALATHERVFLSRRKIIFATALLHDIGKIGLSLFAPGIYTVCLEKMKKQSELSPSNDDYDVAVEGQHFDLAHPEVGSAIVFQTKFLRELETEIDFHHDNTLLRTRNPDAFLGAAVVSIADRLSCLMAAKPQFFVEDLQEILHPHAAYFPLKSGDLMKLFAEVRGRGLLGA